MSKKRGKKERSPDVGPMYREWCKTFFLPIHNSGEETRRWNLSPQEIYKLRCSYFHEGRQKTKEKEGDRPLRQIQFVEPETANIENDVDKGPKIIIQNCDFGSKNSLLVTDCSPELKVNLDKIYDGPEQTLYINVEAFCRVMLQAARKWLEEKGRKPKIQARLKKILTVKKPQETKYFSQPFTPPPAGTTRRPAPPPPSGPPSGSTPSP